MSLDLERLNHAMNEIQKALEQSGYASNSPIIGLLQEARKYAGGVKNLQAKYIQLAQEHL